LGVGITLATATSYASSFRRSLRPSRRAKPVG
jgi:hypothetical protein